MANFDLFQRNEIIDKLKKKSEIFSKYNIEAWVKPQQGYNISIFTVLLKDSQQLTESWEKLTNSIAIHYQSELEKNIEIWNIYVVFLIKKKVGKELKYEVEQDKYSSRKLVYENFSTETSVPIDLQIKSLLDNKLFGFQLNQLKINNEIPKELTSIEEMIKETDMKLYQLIKYVKENSNAKPDKLLDLYMG